MKKVPRILVVEDEAHLAEGLLFNLQAEGYDVELAYDGETALARLLPQHQVDPQYGLVRGSGAGEQATDGSFAEPQQPPQPSRPGILHLVGTGAAVMAEASAPGAVEGADPYPAPSLDAAPVDFDAVLLDVMLPGQSGFDVVRALRAAANYVPVLMLTARGRPEDVLHGLEAGADDYLPKPFDLSILLARLHVLLRRVRWHGSEAAPDQAIGETDQPAAYSFAGGTIDFSLLELRAKGAAIRLTLMEADFLRYLSQNPSRIIPRKELLEQVWRVREDTDTRAIDNFVVRLRRYIEDEPAAPVYLKTVRGVGYRFLPLGE